MGASDLELRALNCSIGDVYREADDCACRSGGDMAVKADKVPRSCDDAVVTLLALRRCRGTD